MVLTIPNAASSGLLLRPTFPGKATFWSAPPRLPHILRLQSTREDGVSSRDYLVSFLSLSPESDAALAITKRKSYSIKSTANADSVIALFADFGFSDTHIAKIFTSCPRFLTYSPDKALRAKLDFLAQSGISGDTLVHIITTDPRILERSLQNKIIPCVNLLNTFFPGDRQALAAFLSNRRAASIFRNFYESNTPANVETLRRHGVPDSNILRLALIGGGPSTLARDSEQFSEIVREVTDMGFDPLGNMFPYGIRTIASMCKKKWVSKLELLKECLGWSDDKQVIALFMKHSNLMTLSEEKMRQGLEILMNRLGWAPEYIAKYPSLLTCSFNKRILPRICVLELLMSKGIVKKAPTGNTFLMSEDSFLRLYVNKYPQDNLQAQLMEVYADAMNMGS